MRIEKNRSLRYFNTFNVDAKAKYYVSIDNEKDIHTLIGKGIHKENKYYILGAGSNTLFVEDYDGLIIRMNLKGMNYSQVNEDHNVVNVAAGEKWHDFVTIMHKNGLYGIENLAYIPGDVGGAPIQNIGAFGVEQKEFFHSLKAVSFDTNESITLSLDDCMFNYRDSVFKHELKDKYLITSVKYMLKKEPVLNYEYSSLAQEIKKFAIEKPDSKYIFDTIVRLRRFRLPDIKKMGNAGSFFKNPIVTKEKADELIDRVFGLPMFKESETHRKVPAAFLIEKAGWKGKRIGNVGVFKGHALIIVNYGGASGKDILEFANEIEADIYDKFNIKLQKEVVIPE